MARIFFNELFGISSESKKYTNLSVRAVVFPEPADAFRII
ncbi:hypothetical protein THEYE_A1136 [Thermodesulfovibrio yellowstonii DSM 11347]|uniref:Uncharacterized protein n=1 Tax=Thermodesulfovibrio yellowstonii (strain ATCC 51303 / DSM 11347 / YP87) TaxID=289376 RepID=B5YL46_THEYD|nr:hypothetical protein THEYE_A1136 [Thermodesulfovibrio yellowstonii DSM 11347]